MGLNWSSDELTQEREKKAAEALHELVWDPSRIISVATIREIWLNSSLTSVSSVHWLRNEMRNAEAEQVRKMKAFGKNGAHNWADYHYDMSMRYLDARVSLTSMLYGTHAPDSAARIQVELRS